MLIHPKLAGGDTYHKGLAEVNRSRKDVSQGRVPQGRKDLLRWETGAGKPVTLPMTIDAAEIVDPVPARGGMINGNTKIGFDSAGRVILSYHKLDERGLTQACTARLESGKWVIRRTSDWKYRRYFEVRFPSDSAP